MYYEQLISTNLLRRVFDRVSQRAQECDAEWLEEAAMPQLKEVDTVAVVQTDGSMVSTVDGWKEAKVGLVYAHDASQPSRRGDRNVRHGQSGVVRRGHRAGADKPY